MYMHRSEGLGFGENILKSRKLAKRGRCRGILSGERNVGKCRGHGFPTFFRLVHKSWHPSPCTLAYQGTLVTMALKSEDESFRKDLFEVVSNWITYKDPIPEQWKGDLKPTYVPGQISFRLQLLLSEF